MVRSAAQIEKQTIVTRLSVSIYSMTDAQLIQLLRSLENDTFADEEKDEEVLARIAPDKGPGLQRQILIARLFVLINQLDKDTLLQRLRTVKHPDFKWVREYPRLACYLMVDFAAGGKAYRSCIRDISASGVFIETADAFQIGQEIALCFTLADSNEMLPFKVAGKVTRLYPDGIGVQYLNMSGYQREIINALVKQASRRIK